MQGCELGLSIISGDEHAVIITESCVPRMRKCNRAAGHFVRPRSGSSVRIVLCVVKPTRSWSLGCFECLVIVSFSTCTKELHNKYKYICVSWCIESAFLTKLSNLHQRVEPVKHVDITKTNR